MPRALTVRFSSIVHSGTEQTEGFEISTANRRVIIRGGLSTGTLGWRLRATAGCLRSRITLRITAVENPVPRVFDLEYHQYEAVITTDRAGVFDIRVSHAYLPNDRAGTTDPHPVFEARVRVPPEIAAEA